MAYTRTNMLTFVNDDPGITVIATDLGNSKTDASGGYKSAIDQALLEYGTAYESLASATVVFADVPKFNKLLRYYVLRLLATTCANKVDIRTEAPSPEKKWSQMSKHLNDLMRDAKAEAQAEGYLADLTTLAGQIGYDEFLIDVIEPDDSEEDV